MKTIVIILVFVLSIPLANAQPCKTVKPGMSKAEVLKVAGVPTEVDSLGSDKSADGRYGILMVWQYGDVTLDGNQRVTFIGDRVEGDVIADGKKYDALIMAFQHGDFPKNELFERIKKLNEEACK
jgi:hypothetical protein